MRSTTANEPIIRIQHEINLYKNVISIVVVHFIKSKKRMKAIVFDFKIYGIPFSIGYRHHFMVLLCSV